MSTRLKNWTAPNTRLLPDFIIGGAMKSGTSTLHQILSMHPDVFIPENEIGFYDIDSIVQHGDFNFYDVDSGKWISQRMDADPGLVWEWYLSKFKKGEGLLKGEDSTTYLASKIAAERIAIQEKEIKMIFLLRQPSKRAYSNYYHMLRTGRATYTFEDTIRYDAFSILDRSLYKQQLEYYYDVLPRDRIKVILFEEMVKDTVPVMKEVCDFLELDFNDLPAEAMTIHANKARLPQNIIMQVKKNYKLRTYGNFHYLNHLPFKPRTDTHKQSIYVRTLNKIHNRINPPVEATIPPINPETKALLDRYFQVELEGIDELTGMDILSKWF